MDVVHDRKKEEILCPKCGDLFHSKAKLGIHIAQNHKVKTNKVSTCSVFKFFCCETFIKVAPVYFILRMPVCQLTDNVIFETLTLNSKLC